MSKRKRSRQHRSTVPVQPAPGRSAVAARPVAAAKLARPGRPASSPAPRAGIPFDRRSLAGAGVVGLIAFVVYALTVERTVPTGDGGELIAAAYVLGVAHPPGYPLYTLLGHLATMLPGGSPALRMNLMSGLLDAPGAACRLAGWSAGSKLTTVKLRSPAALAAAVCCLAASAACGAGVAAAQPALARPTVSLSCLGKPTVKPSEVVLACADAGLGVRRIVWLGWGQPVAAGVGTAFANDCTPTCAAGHFHTYRAVLLLGGAQRCAGKIAYRTATVAIVGAPPPAWTTAADATYPLRCAA